VGTHGGKKSLQARFFAAASPAASALAGFPPAPSRRKIDSKSKQKIKEIWIFFNRSLQITTI
jgi:hypothetical protein